MRRLLGGAGVLAVAGLVGSGLASGAISGPVGVAAGCFVPILAVALFGVPTERLAYLTVCLFAVSVTWNGVRVGGGALGDGPMALAFLTTLVHVAVSRRPVILPPWLMACAAGFALSQLAVLAFPPAPRLVHLTLIENVNLLASGGTSAILPVRSNLSELLKFDLIIVVVPLMLATMSDTWRRCQQLLGLFVVSASVAALSGILDVAGFHVAAAAPSVASRSGGLTIHPNYLALTCVIALPQALLWVGRSPRSTVAGVVTTSLLLGGELASGSRAGAGALAITIAVILVGVPRLRAYLPLVLPLAGALIIGLMVTTPLGREILHQVRLTNAPGTSGSDSQRAAVAHVAWTQIKARPLEGVGFRVIADAHSIYLEILAAGGVIALVSFFGFVGALLRGARRAWIATGREEVLAAVIAMLAWLINGVLDNQVADKYLYFMPGMLLAMMLVSGATGMVDVPAESASEPGSAERYFVSATEPDPAAVIA